MSGGEDISGWAAALEGELAKQAAPIVERVAVLASTGSTQDAGVQLAAGRPGLLVVAAEQTAGRGRLGRPWSGGGLGVAATFVLDGEMCPPERMSIAAGLAAAAAMEGFGLPCGRLGLRWPNDVVEPEPRAGGGRKLAGVLIEKRDGLMLVGIGINVNQREGDFPAELEGKATSLVQLLSPSGRCTVPRIGVLEALVRLLPRTLAMTDGDIVEAWRSRDVLTGSPQAFVHSGRTVRGVVESIEPTGEIVVRDGAGTLVRLPALTTTRVK